MGSESVASCRQPSPASPGSPLLDKAQQSAQKDKFDRVTNKGACFFCNEEGHWVRDCPSRSNQTPGSGSPAAGRRSYPEMQCPCGHGACIVLTSRTVKNPGRDFYRCPGKQSDQCGFFKWCDEAASGQSPKLKSPMKPYQQQHNGINNFAKPAGYHGLKSPVNHGKQLNDADHPNPTCSCGAGKCILMTFHDGENAGRKYFACPIKKGQGACNHFQWYDSAMNAIKIEHSDCLLEKLNLPTQDNKDACKAISIVKAEDMVAQVSPLIQDQMFGQEPQASKIERELKDTHNYIGKGTCNHFQLFDRTTEVGKIEQSDYLLYKPNPPIDAMETEVTFAPVSPLPQDQRDALLQISPVKRLSLTDDRPDVGSPKLKRCLKFGGEGHWLNEFSASPNSPCNKCGRFDHSKCNCPA
ncbi:hypothetical protein IEQ34_004654 [Dendrobium chrysotoxum]|uniref:Uncharacterized protein n=1 Tax=Dendrobium chrysotoxum TaxID=161865 RepID=A0AAV7HEI3_DENCH|nr:hypothetical protein IEQ34_004654 [Dendrobium chrysotoxum]